MQGLHRDVGFRILLVFAANLVFFNPAKSGLRRRKAKLAEPPAEKIAPPVLGRTLPPALDFSPGAAWRLFLRQARLETTGVLKSVLFLIACSIKSERML